MLLRKLLVMVKNDKCEPTEDSVALLKKMVVQKLNRTEAAKYIGVSVSSFNKLIAAGAISTGVKEANECIKWRTDELDAYLHSRTA